MASRRKKLTFEEIQLRNDKIDESMRRLKAEKDALMKAEQELRNEKVADIGRLMIKYFPDIPVANHAAMKRYVRCVEYIVSEHRDEFLGIFEQDPVDGDKQPETPVYQEPEITRIESPENPAIEQAGQQIAQRPMPDVEEPEESQLTEEEAEYIASQPEYQ